MKCIKCHTQNADDAKFCAKCGAPLKKEQVHPANNDRKMYIIIGCLIVAIALAIAALIAVNKRSEKEYYTELMALGNKYYEALNYEKAEIAYLEAIAIDPKQEEPYLYLSAIYVAQEEYDKAISILEQGKEHVESERIDDKILEITEKMKTEQEVIPETEETTVPESNEIAEATPEPSPITVDTFLEEETYLEYTESFANGIAKSYAIIDINQDGIDELLILSQVMDNEFEHISIFGVVDNEVQWVDELDTCYGVNYSKTQKCLVYADSRPSAMGGSENYYTYGENTDDFVISWELDMTTYEPEYEKILANGEEISMTSSEYDQYQNELTYITFHEF